MTSIKLSITGEGITVDKEITFVQAGQIIAFLGSSTGELQKDQQLNINSSDSLISINNRPIKSPRELVDQYAAKTNAQKILVLADYLCKKDGKTTFEPQEIKSLFGRSGYGLPRNFSRDLKDAVRLHYIFDETGSGIYIISETGNNILESGGFTQIIAKRKRKKVALRKASEAVPVSEEVKEVQFKSSLEGYPSYFQMKTKGQKILWILAYFDSNNIRYISPKDIEYATSQLKGTISTRVFTALNQTNLNNGYEEVSENKFAITQIGIDYLKTLI